MAKKEKNSSKKEQNEHSSKDFNILARLLGPIRILIRMHVKVASVELKKDSKRYISGIINIFIGIFFIIGFWSLLNILAIVAIKEFTFLNLFYSVLIVAGSNLFISMLMFISAIAKFKKPFLKETKKVFKETLDDLKAK